ncbi:MAG: hypothetical protein LUG17_04410 [Clostridiales bacterium]|nr:hypothetical protein [Clostridiales bacterium]
MNLIRCENGHFYDTDRFSMCPRCLDENKLPKIFISHAARDERYIRQFVDLLEFIGVRPDQLLCSSIPGYDVPEGKNIYEYLQEQFDSYKLHIFYMLSNNYYQSAASLNEMGAGWILRMKYTTILLPGFEYEKIKGAVDPCVISAKLDANRYQVRSKLKQIKTKLEEEFELTPKPDERWDEKVDEFIEAVNRLAEEETNNHEKTDEPADIESTQPVKQEKSVLTEKEPFVGTGITKQELLMPDDQKALLGNL